VVFPPAYSDHTVLFMKPIFKAVYNKRVRTYQTLRTMSRKIQNIFLCLF
jgi:hypothetical protein